MTYNYKHEQIPGRTTERQEEIGSRMTVMTAMAH